ncbi:extracellular solute-binding protein, partial [Streptomyces sp. NPDC094149]|uniref:ABC transporter substrate-binding protein n=1 Tax=Streptomyces sp. NPDC094149 TaxID=3155079 RepID=UPI00331FF6C1
MNAVPNPYPSRRGVLRVGGGLALAATAGVTLSGCTSGADDGVGPDGKVTLEMWHGQTDTGKKALQELVAAFEKSHPKIRVKLGGGVLADAMLQKVTAGLAAGSYPDIAYIFGSDLASIAASPLVVDLSDTVHSGPTPWSNYWAPAREAVTVKGKVRAAPALLDSLAVVCNKKVFREANLPLPKAGWTWQDFQETAKKLTDKGRGRFGTGWPGAGDEDTVWRLWPMIWDLGGDVVDRGGKKIGFA